MAAAAVVLLLLGLVGGRRARSVSVGLHVQKPLVLQVRAQRLVDMVPVAVPVPERGRVAGRAT